MPHLRNYKVTLIDDNGAASGIGSLVLGIKAVDRRTAQEVAMRFAKKIGGVGPVASTFRLADSEMGLVNR